MESSYEFHPKTSRSMRNCTSRLSCTGSPCFHLFSQSRKVALFIASQIKMNILFIFVASKRREATMVPNVLLSRILSRGVSVTRRNTQIQGYSPHSVSTKENVVNYGIVFPPSEGYFPMFSGAWSGLEKVALKAKTQTTFHSFPDVPMATYPNENRSCLITSEAPLGGPIWDRREDSRQPQSSI